MDQVIMHTRAHKGHSKNFKNVKQALILEKVFIFEIKKDIYKKPNSTIFNTEKV